MLKTIGIATCIAALAFFVAVVSILATRSLMQPPYHATDQAAENNSQDKTAQDKQVKTRWEQIVNRTFNDPVAFFTAILALFSGMLVIVAALQLSLLFSADVTSTKAANAAQLTAEATMAAQRAFVVPIPYYAPDKNPTLGQPLNWNFGVIWMNGGNLATRDMQNHIDYRLMEKELPDDFAFPDDADPIARGTMLGPKQQVFGPHIPASGVIDADEIPKLKDGGGKALYIFGWAKYFDGFDGTPERITKFCFRVRATANPDVPFVFPPCTKHNSAN